jgi:diaminopimelate decarboxylase
VSLALAAGWKPQEISYTGTNLSDRDLDVILAQPLVLNLDSLSAIRRVGVRAPGRGIGLRINPRVGTGYSPQLTYAGEKPTKFGIYADRFTEALEESRRRGLPASRAEGGGHLGLPERGRICGRHVFLSLRAAGGRGARGGAATECR